MRKIVLEKIEKLTWDDESGVHNYQFPDGSKLAAIVSSLEEPRVRLLMVDENGLAKKYYLSELTDRSLIEIYEFLIIENSMQQNYVE